MDRDTQRQEYALAAYLLLTFTLCFGWWVFSHELRFVDVQYSDVAFHLSVLKALDAAVTGGQNPLDFWYDTTPYGFALFRSYQYLPYLFMYGFYALASEYVSLWMVLIGSTCLLASTALPLSIFFSMRLLGARLIECAFAAALSVLIADGSEYGMGLQNYTFGTVGIITQLWALVFLFLAIAASFRYIRDGSNLGTALLFSFLTFGSHVVAAVVVAICAATFSIGTLIEKRQFNRRPFVFFSLFLAVTAHQWWFVLTDGPFIHRSLLEPAWKYEGRGVAYLVDLFWSGELFDRGRFPAITLMLLVAGVYNCVYWMRVRTRPGGAFYAYAVPLFLFFFSLCAGRQLWGWLLNLLPVLQSLHIHRFSIAVHLFGIVIVSCGAGALAHHFAATRVRKVFITLLFLAALYPAATERSRMIVEAHKRQRDTATLISQDTGLQDMLQALAKLPYGWTYIGSKTSWQSDLLVAGYIPLDLMTSTRGIPTVGGILYHAFSLAGETLFDFNPNNPAHFDLFGIRNVVSPATWQGVSGFTHVGTFGRYALWTRASHMMFVGDRQFAPESEFRKHTDFVRIFVQRFAGRQSEDGGFEHQSMREPWRFDGEVTMHKAGTVVAVEGYHPGWKAFVDGQPASTRRVTPGLVAVDVPEGRHTVSFAYQGSSLKFALLCLSIGIIGIALKLGTLPTSARGTSESG